MKAILGVSKEAAGIHYRRNIWALVPENYFPAWSSFIMALRDREAASLPYRDDLCALPAAGTLAYRTIQKVVVGLPMRPSLRGN